MTQEERFIIELAISLQKNGIPAHRLEDTMDQVCAKFNIKADFYSSPNSLFVSFPEKEGEQTYLKKIKAGDLNLELLNKIDRITKAIVKRNISASEGLKQLSEVDYTLNRYGALINILFFGVSTGSAACLFGGGYAAILVSSIIGFVVGGLIQLLTLIPSLGKVLVLISSFFAIVISKTAVLLFGSYAQDIALLTGLIILIPGFSFSLSINELANGHPMSGTNRMANAMVTFVMIAFGVGLGGKFMLLFDLTPASFVFPQIPFWTKFIALFCAPAGFVVLFKAIPKHFIWMLVSCTVSYYALTYFSSFNLDELSVFFASLTLGIVCNGVSRITDNPVSLMLVPGIILLVPGSIGFKSIDLLANAETLSGIESAFSTVITAVALSAGLLLSTMIVKPKRAL